MLLYSIDRVWNAHTHTLALARVHLTHSTHWLQHRSICLILYICSLFLVLIPRLTSYFPFLWIVPHSTHETLFRSASQQQQVKAEWNPIHLAVRINTMVVKWMWFSELYNWFHEKRMGQLKWDEDDDVKSKRKKDILLRIEQLIIMSLLFYCGFRL